MPRFKTRLLIASVSASLLTLMSLLHGAQEAAAATGNQGYAVYRDGVLFGLEWHAGLMDDPHWNTTSWPVVQAPGGSEIVKWDTWSNFLGGATYKGVYRPRTAPSSGSRDNFVYMGRILKNENIGYNGLYQVFYNPWTSGTWVDASEISSMRCDGVIEYVYEWYNFRVYGSDTRWDVTKADFWNQDAHSGTAITPKSQVNYLTKVSSSLP